MSLKVRLSDEEKLRLDSLATAFNLSPEDVVRALINEKFESIQDDKTLVERRGGHPEFLLDVSLHASERSNREEIISKRVSDKHSRRRPKDESF